MTPPSLPTSPPGGPTAHPKKLLGFWFPHFVRGSEIRPSRKRAALESGMLPACTHMHAHIDQRLIDWCHVSEMWGWGWQAEHWRCRLLLSCSEMLLTYTHLLEQGNRDEAISKEKGQRWKAKSSHKRILFIYWTGNCTCLIFLTFCVRKWKIIYDTKLVADWLNISPHYVNVALSLKRLASSLTANQRCSH